MLKASWDFVTSSPLQIVIKCIFPSQTKGNWGPAQLNFPAVLFYAESQQVKSSQAYLYGSNSHKSIHYCFEYAFFIAAKYLEDVDTVRSHNGVNFLHCLHKYWNLHELLAHFVPLRSRSREHEANRLFHTIKRLKQMENYLLNKIYMYLVCIFF